MPSKELSQAIDCIDGILGGDNKNLIGQIDVNLNAKGISLDNVCDAIDQVADFDCGDTLNGLIDQVPFIGGLNPGDVSSYGSGLVASIIEKGKTAATDAMKQFSDLETMGSTFADNISALPSQSDFVQVVLGNTGVGSINASDLINDATDSLNSSKIGELARQTRDGMKKAFDDLSSMSTDSLKQAEEGNQPDFNVGDQLCQGLNTVFPAVQYAQMAASIASSLCDVYDFVKDINSIAADVNAILADPLRGLNTGITLEKNACISLIEDLVENGLPEDICEMNSHYSSTVTIGVGTFGNDIMNDLALEIDNIVGDLLDFKLDLDLSWKGLNEEISPCEKRFDYSSDGIRSLIDNNNKVFNSYNSLHDTYNDILNQMNQEVTVEDIGTSTTILEPLNLSEPELDFLNGLFANASGLIDDYLALMRDIRLAEDIKRFDFLDKYKVPYRNQNFDLKSNRTLSMGTQGEITGEKFNYLDDNTSQLVIKCNEF